MAALAVAVPAHADDCMGASVEHVRAPGARGDVRVEAPDSPDASWTLQVGGRRHSLSEVPSHAHLLVLVPRGARSVAVVRTGAGHDLDDRVLVYDLSGRLLRSFDLSALLTPRGLLAVQRTFSVSHMQWLRPGGATFLPDGHTVRLAVTTGSPVDVRL